MNSKIKTTSFTFFFLIILSTANAANVEITNNLFPERDFETNSDDISQQRYLQQVKENYQHTLQLIKQNKRIQANQNLTALIDQDPKQSVYYQLKALLALLDKQPEQAKQSFLKAIELNPRNTQALTGLSKLALENKQYSKAKQYAEQVLQINISTIPVYQILADIAIQQQGIDAAEHVLLEAKANVKGDLKAELEIIKLLGKLYIAKKQPEKLQRLASNFAKQYPDNVDALYLLTEAQISNKNFSAAEKTLRKIIDKHPSQNAGEYHFLLAKILIEQNKTEEEILNHLDQAANLLENPNQVLAYKTAFLIRHKHLDQALSFAQQVNKDYPNRSIGKLLLGKVFLEQKKYSQALQNYKQAYSITPDIEILDIILRILNDKKELTKAITLLNNILAKDENNDLVRLRLADTYQNIGKYKESIKHYQTLLAKHPDNVILLNNMALAYNQQNNPKALQLAKQAYDKAPQSGIIADTYGTVLLKQGQNQQALEILKKASELAPNITEIQLHLAEAYYANKDYQQAKQILQTLINKHSPQEQAAKKYLSTWK